ncbi:hypothetical protein J6590_004978 [Homalodisca vitripennis]|nr:hypothetical protein J6590_004978 [Homalodisca vitripennis]
MIPRHRQCRCSLSPSGQQIRHHILGRVNDRGRERPADRAEIPSQPSLNISPVDRSNVFLFSPSLIDEAYTTSNAALASTGWNYLVVKSANFIPRLIPPGVRRLYTTRATASQPGTARHAGFQINCPSGRGRGRAHARLGGISARPASAVRSSEATIA